MKNQERDGVILKPQSKTLTKKSLTSEEKTERDESRKEKVNNVLPASLIPGHKEFNRKRLEDIENKENDYQRTRADGKPKKEGSAAMKFVKKIFKKKK